jgi:taurine--2-oxoglutarate transaminase
MLVFLMALDTKRAADTSRVVKETKDHVLVSWSAQGALSPLVITGAKGSWLHAGERRILDFSSGLINVNLGHGHPKVVRAIQEQAERLCYVTPSFGEESRADLARLMAEITPGDLTKTLFTTGGSEANEHALRIARMYTKRHKVLTQWRSFHGQTQGAATLGGDNRRWANEPGITGVVRFLNPDPYRSMFGNDAQKALAHVEEVLWYEGPEYVAAIFLEPIVGSSGLIVPPDGFLRGLRALCDKHGILLILDEVMTGFGRTGKWFAAEHEGVVPDMLTFAKGVNSGYVPLGGVIVNEAIAKHFDANVLWAGLTYAGHPLACAAGVATIEAYRDERLIERGARSGEFLMREASPIGRRRPRQGPLHRHRAGEGPEDEGSAGALERPLGEAPDRDQERAHAAGRLHPQPLEHAVRRAAAECDRGRDRVRGEGDRRGVDGRRPVRRDRRALGRSAGGL